MINIIRKGFAHIPNEAYVCPVCGKKTDTYFLQNLEYADPTMNLCQAIIKDYAQKFPTFLCMGCQTVWQYLGEKEEDKE